MESKIRLFIPSNFYGDYFILNLTNNNMFSYLTESSQYQHHIFEQFVVVMNDQKLVFLHYFEIFLDYF